MKPRKPILVMLVVGLTVITALSFVPYTLTFVADAEQLVSATFDAAPAAASSNARVHVETPPFDAAAWYGIRGEQVETHGVLAETYDGGKTIAAHNANALYNPASLIKLATSLAVLRKLGVGYRFQTRVYADGAIDSNGTLRGSLHFAGNDPTFGDVTALRVLDELKTRGIKRVTEGIFVSPDFSFNYNSPEKSAQNLARSLKLPAKKWEASEQATGALLFTVESNPLPEILLYMNAHSVNFIAERLGDLVGGASGVTMFLVSEVKIPARDVLLESTSGLGHNQMTPRGMIAVVRALVEETKRLGLKPEEIMPVVSDDTGTLRRRMKGTELEGAVVAKTGTLTQEVDGGMSSLAGLVYTKNEGMILFAIFDQGNRIADNRQMQDEILRELVLSQDAPRPLPQVARKLLPREELIVH
ncbi:MAG: D-alanyl-D-alanine carboxypeptidase [Pyrinomonadaceae bacterium]|nr:D-alanyl-D-alanine carboxypeptidase [Pyrinomonadaceae bacterium]